jgi:hypothetical protein
VRRLAGRGFGGVQLAWARVGVARPRRAWRAPVRGWRRSLSQTRPRFVEALLFDVVYKNPVSSCSTSQPLHHLLPSPPTHEHPSFPSFPPFPCAAPSLPRRGLGLGPTSLAPRCLPLCQNQLFRPAPTRSRTMAASLDPGCDIPSSRAALNRLTMLYRARESTFRTLSVRRPSIPWNPNRSSIYKPAFLSRHSPFDL